MENEQIVVEWVKSEMLKPDLNMKEILEQIKQIEEEITTELLKLSKMEDRIQVNGEWYVKELTTPPVKLDLTHSLQSSHQMIFS